MATLTAVLPLDELSRAHWDALRELHVDPVDEPVSRPLIESSFAHAEELARRVSESIEGRALAICMQTGADVYLLAEFERGTLRRRISYERDGEGWNEAEGEPRAWEAELHFARGVDAVLDELGDDDEPPEPATLSAIRRAFEERDVVKLPMLPRPNGASVAKLLESLGAPPSPTARHRPGFWSRLFG